MQKPSLLNTAPVTATPELKRDWTQGNILGNLWSLALPMMVNNVANALGPTIDMIWVGQLGSSSVAGVGISVLAVTMINSLINGLFVGSTAMIARFIGAKD